MEIEQQKLIELINQVKETKSKSEEIADSVSDMLNKLSAYSEALDNLYDDLILLINTQGP